MADRLIHNSYLEKALRENKTVQILEIIAVFSPAIIMVSLAPLFAGGDPLIRQSMVWLANVTMLLLVWAGLRLRNQGWKDLGLGLQNINLKSVLLSFVVFIAAVFGFIFGSVIMANIVGIPESADMSGYQYMQGNLPLLILALIAVFIASSFGEEVMYRGFLISRIAGMGNNSKAWIWTAVLISSIIFGLVHFDWGPMGIVQTGFMGLALGISYIWLNRNLWILVFAHAYMDAILMVQMYLGIAI